MLSRSLTCAALGLCDDDVRHLFPLPSASREASRSEAVISFLHLFSHTLCGPWHRAWVMGYRGCEQPFCPRARLCKGMVLFN